MPTSYTSPNGRWLLLVRDDNIVELWDTSTDPDALRETCDLATLEARLASRPAFIPVNQYESEFKPTGLRARFNLIDRGQPRRVWHQGVPQ